MNALTVLFGDNCLAQYRTFPEWQMQVLGPVSCILEYKRAAERASVTKTKKTTSNYKHRSMIDQRSSLIPSLEQIGALQNPQNPQSLSDLPFQLGNSSSPSASSLSPKSPSSAENLEDSSSIYLTPSGRPDVDTATRALYLHTVSLHTSYQYHMSEGTDLSDHIHVECTPSTAQEYFNERIKDMQRTFFVYRCSEDEAHRLLQEAADEYDADDENSSMERQVDVRGKEKEEVKDWKLRIFYSFGGKWEVFGPGGLEGWERPFLGPLDERWLELEQEENDTNVVKPMQFAVAYRIGTPGYTWEEYEEATDDSSSSYSRSSSGSSSSQIWYEAWERMEMGEMNSQGSGFEGLSESWMDADEYFDIEEGGDSDEAESMYSSLVGGGSNLEYETEVGEDFELCPQPPRRGSAMF